MKIAATPHPPYYAVIFTSQLKSNSDGYEETANKMLELVSKERGFLGVESARNQNGFGLTVSYWENLEAIETWKKNSEHLMAQAMGRSIWYENYKIRIVHVQEERMSNA